MNMERENPVAEAEAPVKKATATTFAGAASQLETTNFVTRYVATTLDSMDMSAEATGMSMRALSTGGPGCGMVLYKLNNTNYAGMLMSYNMSSNDTLIMFAHRDSNCTIAVL